MVDEIVQQAAETASSLLVPEDSPPTPGGRLTGIERFVLRMMDMETTGAAKLDNYQNFAKAFRVTDYTRVMGDMRPNNARLKRVSEYASRDLTDATEIGVTRPGISSSSPCSNCSRTPRRRSSSNRSAPRWQTLESGPAGGHAGLHRAQSA